MRNDYKIHEDTIRFSGNHANNNTDNRNRKTTVDGIKISKLLTLFNLFIGNNLVIYLHVIVVIDD